MATSLLRKHRNMDSVRKCAICCAIFRSTMKGLPITEAQSMHAFAGNNGDFLDAWLHEQARQQPALFTTTKGV